jgi:hypothetical protein
MQILYNFILLGPGILFPRETESQA